MLLYWSQIFVYWNILHSHRKTDKINIYRISLATVNQLFDLAVVCRYNIVSEKLYVFSQRKYATVWKVPYDGVKDSESKQPHPPLKIYSIKARILKYYCQVQTVADIPHH